METSARAINRLTVGRLVSTLAGLAVAVTVVRLAVARRAERSS
jgi:hypothetical protein